MANPSAWGGLNAGITSGVNIYSQIAQLKEATEKRKILQQQQQALAEKQRREEVLSQVKLQLEVGKAGGDTTRYKSIQTANKMLEQIGMPPLQSEKPEEAKALVTGAIKLIKDRQEGKITDDVFNPAWGGLSEDTRNKAMTSVQKESEMNKSLLTETEARKKNADIEKMQSSLALLTNLTQTAKKEEESRNRVFQGPNFAQLPSQDQTKFRELSNRGEQPGIETSQGMANVQAEGLRQGASPQATKAFGEGVTQPASLSPKNRVFRDYFAGKKMNPQEQKVIDKEFKSEKFTQLPDIELNGKTVKRQIGPDGKIHSYGAGGVTVNVPDRIKQQGEEALAKKKRSLLQPDFEGEMAGLAKKKSGANWERESRRDGGKSLKKQAAAFADAYVRVLYPDKSPEFAEKDGVYGWYIDVDGEKELVGLWSKP